MTFLFVEPIDATMKSDELPSIRKRLAESNVEAELGEPSCRRFKDSTHQRLSDLAITSVPVIGNSCMNFIMPMRETMGMFRIPKNSTSAQTESKKKFGYVLTLTLCMILFFQSFLLNIILIQMISANFKW